MRIGIYVETAKSTQPTGIGLHVRHLVRCLGEIDTENEYLLYYLRPLLSESKVLPYCPPRKNFRLRPVRFPRIWLDQHPRLWWDWVLPRVLRRDRIDVFHGPNHFLPQFDRGPNVLTIHDLAYFKTDSHGAKMDEALRDLTRTALARATSVIALSENTRRDVEELGVPPSDVRVIYGGGNVVPDSQIQYQRREELKQAYSLPEKYILFVGTIMPRKNVPFLLRAFARLKRESGLPHRLVLAGHMDPKAGDLRGMMQDLGIASEVLVTGYVEDWQLPLLYKLSDLFVLPTRYEGFTLVTLEAMAYQVPVVATDTSSIREGTGDAAVLVPVDDDAALAQAMLKVLTDEELRRRMIALGEEQAKKFTWEQCARETLTLYHDVVASPARNGQVVLQAR
jgi:glycosyltransferase involved in cell wall biosynthesis